MQLLINIGGLAVVAFGSYLMGLSPLQALGLFLIEMGGITAVNGIWPR